jgi:hypothetical protein
MATITFEGDGKKIARLTKFAKCLRLQVVSGSEELPETSPSEEDQKGVLTEFDGMGKQIDVATDIPEDTEKPKSNKKSNKK